MLRAVRDVLLGAACAGCGRPGELMCAACAAPLAALPSRAVPVPEPPGLPAVWAVADYDGAVRAALIAHKETARLGLARPLGSAVARAVAAAVAPGRGGTRSAADPGVSVVLVPVPSVPAAVRARGHDATARLARAAAADLRGHGLAVAVMPLLRLRRRVRDQAGLDAQARQDNLAGAFRLAISPDRLARQVHLGGSHIVIVDDLITTGATMTAAAAALAPLVPIACSGAVIAATRRRGGPTPAGQTD